MADKHGSSRLDIFGAPEVKKLYNDRYRVVIRTDLQSKGTDWYYDHKDEIFKEFGDLYTKSLNIGDVEYGWEARDGEAYPNMRLVSTELLFIPQRTNPLVEFVYETLTSEYVQESVEKVDYELNGLRRVTRSVIAEEGSSYAEVVGASTITHNALGYGDKTLHLGSAIEDAKTPDEGGFTRIQEVWFEHGKLREKTGGAKDGITSISKTFLGSVTESGPLGSECVDSETGNYEGLKTITKTYWDIPPSGFSFDSTIPFTIPGTVGIKAFSLGTAIVNAVDGLSIRESYFNYVLDVYPPVSTQCKATTTITYSRSSSINQTGLYQPDGWTRAIVSGIGLNNRPFTSISTFSNHIAVSNGVSKRNASSQGGTVYLVQGNRIYGGTRGEIEIEGPKSDPAGSSIKLIARSDPDFVTEHGIQYYKQTIVMAQVPRRG